MTQAYNLSQLANRVDVNGRIDMSTATTGTLPLAQTPLIMPVKGGTGLTTITANAVLIGNGISNVTTISPGAVNNVLISNGTNWTSGSVVLPGTVVNSLTGTVSQINVSGTTGNIVLSTPQGIGLTSTPQFSALGIGTAPGVAGSIQAIGNIVAYFSDDRLKDRGDNIKNALDKVRSLNGFSFTPNKLAVELGYESIKDVGVSAQEVEKVMPCAVVPAPISSDYLTVRYEKLIPLLIEAIKELDIKVTKLKVAHGQTKL